MAAYAPHKGVPAALLLMSCVECQLIGTSRQFAAAQSALHRDNCRRRYMNSMMRCLSAAGGPCSSESALSLDFQFQRASRARRLVQV
jgi:hypothetical protein